MKPISESSHDQRNNRHQSAKLCTLIDHRLNLIIVSISDITEENIVVIEENIADQRPYDMGYVKENVAKTKNEFDTHLRAQQTSPNISQS